MPYIVIALTVAFGLGCLTPAYLRAMRETKRLTAAIQRDRINLAPLLSR